MHIRQKSSRHFPADVLYGETTGEDIEEIEREVGEILQRRKYESMLTTNYDKYRSGNSTIVIINHVKQHVVKMEPIPPQVSEKSSVEATAKKVKEKKEEQQSTLLLL